MYEYYSVAMWSIKGRRADRQVFLVREDVIEYEAQEMSYPIAL
jgi:hypothetical protein